MRKPGGMPLLYQVPFFFDSGVDFTFPIGGYLERIPYPQWHHSFLGAWPTTPERSGQEHGCGINSHDSDKFQ